MGTNDEQLGAIGGVGKRTHRTVAGDELLYLNVRVLLLEGSDALGQQLRLFLLDFCPLSLGCGQSGEGKPEPACPSRCEPQSALRHERQLP